MTRITGVLRFAALLFPVVALAQNYQGNLDAARCDLIGGWAWDANQPNTPINVDIYNGPTYVKNV